MDHGRKGPQGVLGGSDGDVNKVRVTRDGKTHIPPHLSKEQDIHITSGDRIRVSTPGGGGYGDPLDRDPELVSHDVSRGYYSVEEAADLYGVVIAADEVDARATSALRSERRNAVHVA